MKKIYIIGLISMLSSVNNIFPAVSDIKKIGQEVGVSVSAAPGAIGRKLKQTGKEIFRTEAQKEREAAEKMRIAEQRKQEQLLEKERQAFEIHKRNFPTLRNNLDMYGNQRLKSLPIIKAMIENDLARVKSLVEAGGINVNRTYKVESGSGYATVIEEQVPLLFFTNNWDIARYLMGKGARYEGYKRRMEQVSF